MAGLSVDNVMALRQSILQRNSALQDAASATASPATAKSGGADFTSALKSALEDVNNMQNAAGDAATLLRAWRDDRHRCGDARQTEGLDRFRDHAASPQQTAVRLQGHHEHAGVM